MECDQQNLRFERHELSVNPILTNRPNDFLRRPIRKRAAKACLACRARKIRCDVVVCGKPCMNCRLDNAECKVLARPTKYDVASKKSLHDRAPIPAFLQCPTAGNLPGSAQVEEHGYLNDSNESSSSTHDRRFSRATIDFPSQYVRSMHDLPDRGGISADQHIGRGNNSDALLIDEPVDQSLLRGQGNEQTGMGIIAEHQHHDISFSFSDPHKGTVSGNAVPRHIDQLPLLEHHKTTQDQVGHVPYYSYPFIESDDLSDISPSDIDYLNRQGSFSIPARPALEALVRHYFLCVHPFLPVLDEALFWDMFADCRKETGGIKQMSLFTFQAMLFASSSFVPVNILQDIGFTSTRDARTVFYRRAKVLFDVDGERDTISTAQGALLLSYYSPKAHNRTMNTRWLETAIHYAKQAGAHQFTDDVKMTESQQFTSKRLWWSCILRDRILPLGVHRPLHITHEYFNVGNNLLTIEDFDGEIQKSRVYDSVTKRILVNLLIELCKLCIVLTDVILVVCPLDGFPRITSGATHGSDLRGRIDRCRAALAWWFCNAIIQFPTPAGIGNTNESVILFTNLMYIYYHSAKVALCHHEVLHWETPSTANAGYRVQLLWTKKELQESIAAITENTKEVILLKLAKYLPISAVAYTALPLVLHILDVKLSSTQSQMTIKQRQLEVFMEAMKIYRSQYDGTDTVANSIERLVAYLETGNMLKWHNHSVQNSRQVSHKVKSTEVSPPTAALAPVLRDWSDVFLQKTRCYLRIAVTLELAFSKATYPDDADFPASLQNQNLLSTLFPLYRNGLAEKNDDNRYGRARHLQSRGDSARQNGQEQNNDDSPPGSIVRYTEPPSPFPHMAFSSADQESMLDTHFGIDSAEGANLTDLDMEAQLWSHIHLDDCILLE